MNQKKTFKVPHEASRGVAASVSINKLEVSETFSLSEFTMKSDSDVGRKTYSPRARRGSFNYGRYLVIILIIFNYGRYLVIIIIIFNYGRYLVIILIIFVK